MLEKSLTMNILIITLLSIISAIHCQDEAPVPTLEENFGFILVSVGNESNSNNPTVRTDYTVRDGQYGSNCNNWRKTQRGNWRCISK